MSGKECLVSYEASPLQRNVVIFCGKVDPSEPERRRLTKIVEFCKENGLSILHGGTSGSMAFIASECQKLSLNDVGIGTWEINQDENVPRTGKEFLLAGDYFKRVTSLMSSSPLAIVMPEGGSGTLLEATLYAKQINLLAGLEQKGFEIPANKERRLIVISENGIDQRFREAISQFGLKADCKGRIIFCKETELKDVLKVVLSQLFG